MKKKIWNSRKGKSFRGLNGNYFVIIIDVMVSACYPIHLTPFSQLSQFMYNCVGDICVLVALFSQSLWTKCHDKCHHHNPKCITNDDEQDWGVPKHIQELQIVWFMRWSENCLWFFFSSLFLFSVVKQSIMCVFVFVCVCKLIWIKACHYGISFAQLQFHFWSIPIH